MIQGLLHSRGNTPSFRTSRESGADPESIEGREALRWIPGQARDDEVLPREIGTLPCLKLVAEPLPENPTKNPTGRGLPGR